MTKLVGAHTNFDPMYPGYINFTREDDGSVSVYLRGDPSIKDGAYVCGYARDKGQPGRCTPGDGNCNNYCNMAPEKGAMQPAPQNCQQVICGETVKLTLSADAFASFIAGLVT